jgi:glycosyltransferase involved in cell wall biosynthesis
MAKTLPSVTVGIPAYNEAANIAHLLMDVLTQHEDGFVLEKIVVLSDGSSDATVAKARAVSEDQRIVVIDDKGRKGKATRLNEIMKETKSDILVLLDADIQLDGQYFLRDLIRPQLCREADLSAGRVLAMKPETIVGYALDAGLLCKDFIFSRWRSGKNVYTCCGVARALSRRCYETLRFSESVGEDAYSYFFVLKNGLRYAFTPEAGVLIKHPGTLADYFRQSRRFVQSRGIFLKEFGAEFVEAEYAIPTKIFLTGCLYAFLSRPLSFSCYLTLNALSQMKALSRETLSQTWDVATSSKQLHS